MVHRERGKPSTLAVIQNADVGQDQRSPSKISQRARCYDLKFPMRLHQENQHTLVRAQKIVCKVISGLGRKIDSDWIDGFTWTVEGFLVFGDPFEDFAPCGQI